MIKPQGAEILALNANPNPDPNKQFSPNIHVYLRPFSVLLREHSELAQLGASL